MSKVTLQTRGHTFVWDDISNMYEWPLHKGKNQYKKWNARVGELEKLVIDWLIAEREEPTNE